MLSLVSVTLVQTLHSTALICIGWGGRHNPRIDDLVAETMTCSFVLVAPQ